MTTEAPARRRPLGLIPARGGSKRIPRKNVVDFCGKPIIAWTIEAARDSGLFDLVHVSTDDEEIAEVARRYGGDPQPRRPAELADDVTPLLPVARWVVETLAAAGRRYDDVFILFPCAPLLEAKDLVAAYDVYLSHGAKRNLLTVARAPAFPEWYFRRASDGRLDPITPGGSFIRSQELQPAYYETGTFTIFSAEWLLNAASLTDDTNYVALELPVWKAVDIDEPADLDHARMLFSLLRGKAGS